MNELSQIIGIEKTKLARILHLLTTRGLFKEGEYIFNPYQFISCDLVLVNQDVFVNNCLLLIIKSTCNAGYLVHLEGEMVLQVASVLLDALNDPP